jgi:hypothetical protein
VLGRSVVLPAWRAKQHREDNMRLGRILSKLGLVAGLCLLLAAPSFSQQWPYGQRSPQSTNPYGSGDINGYSSRITQQPIVQYVDQSSAVLQWSTDSNFNTYIRIGTDPNNLNGVVRSSGAGNPHMARIANQLQPGQTYFFQIFDPSSNPLTPVLAFQTPTNGTVRGVPVQLASDMASNGYGRRNRDRYADRDRDSDRGAYANQDRDRDGDRGAYASQDRDRDQSANGQYGYGNNRDRLPQGDYGYGRGNADEQNAGVQILGRPQIRLNGNGSAIVTWNTNVPASAVVHYGADPNSLTQTAEAPWGGTTHTVTVNNLNPGVEYYFQVQSGQAQGSGTGITSPVIRFRVR